MRDGLISDSFNEFLRSLDADRVRAAEKYLALRERLERFFEWRNCEVVEELTDIVFDRVVKKIEEGEEIQNAEAFSITVAKFVLMENRRETFQTAELDENSRDLSLDNLDKDMFDVQIRQQRFDCLNQCLRELPDEKRKLLIRYFNSDEKTMIPARKSLAHRLGINLNTLRIRVSRLKSKLEKCTKECCSEQKTG